MTPSKNVLAGRCSAAKTAAICLMAYAILPVHAKAGEKPANPQPAAKAIVEEIFRGNSWNWSHGGAFHAPDGTMVGKWIANSDRKGHYLDVIGHGRWTVNNKGTLCHDAEWRWRRNGELRKRFVKDCWKHVTDANGNLWQHDRRHGWYPFPKQQLRSGDRFSKRYSRISRTHNLWEE